MIRIPDGATYYYNFPLSLKREARVEKVEAASMNTDLDRNTSSDNLNNQKSNIGFQEVLQTEIKKYR